MKSMIGIFLFFAISIISESFINKAHSSTKVALCIEGEESRGHHFLVAIQSPGDDQAHRYTVSFKPEEGRSLGFFGGKIVPARVEAREEIESRGGRTVVPMFYWELPELQIRGLAELNKKIENLADAIQQPKWFYSKSGRAGSGGGKVFNENTFAIIFLKYLGVDLETNSTEFIRKFFKGKDTKKILPNPALSAKRFTKELLRITLLNSADIKDFQGDLIAEGSPYVKPLGNLHGVPFRDPKRSNKLVLTRLEHMAFEKEIVLERTGPKLLFRKDAERPLFLSDDATTEYLGGYSESSFSFTNGTSVFQGVTISDKIFGWVS